MLGQALGQGLFGVAVGEKKPQRTPGGKLKRLAPNAQSERLGKFEVSDDPQQFVNFLNTKSQPPLRCRHPQANEKRQQPVTSLGVIILWQNNFNAASIIVSRREVGAEQQLVALQQQLRQARQDHVRLKVRNHPEEGEHALGFRRNDCVEHLAKVGRIGQVAHERVNSFERQLRRRCFARHPRHRLADVARHVVDNRVNRLQLAQVASVLLAAAATQTNETNRLIRRLGKRLVKCPVVNRLHAGIGPRRRMRPVHREPLLRLTIAVVQKLGRHLAKPKAVEQLSLNGMRKLTMMNDHVCRRSSKATF